MILLLNFQRATNDAVALYLKRQQFVVKVIWQIKEERTSWEERKRQRESIRRSDL